MLAQLEMFGQNIALLGGLLCCCGACLVLLVAAWTGLNIAIWKQRQAAYERPRRRPQFDLDGSVLPPLVRGACTGCGHVFGQVCELPDGRRFCAHCYRKLKAGKLRTEGASAEAGTPADEPADGIEPPDGGPDEA
ncbi:MAG TPA: hypothetical protein PKC49_00925 [Phycisphaerae bacterium]|nr:hypothetical protein [Phycisphaerae bacterium]